MRPNHALSLYRKPITLRIFQKPANGQQLRHGIHFVPTENQTVTQKTVRSI